MAKVTSISLTSEERTALEGGRRQGKSQGFRQRCHMILLKAEALPSQEVADRVGCCEAVVNTWLSRYKAQGLGGLKTRPGQGRRAILQAETDLAAVRCAVQSSRQRVGLAKAELERELGKSFSALTLRRFLKKMAAASSASDGG